MSGTKQLVCPFEQTLPRGPGRHASGNRPGMEVFVRRETVLDWCLSLCCLLSDRGRCFRMLALASVAAHDGQVEPIQDEGRELPVAPLQAAT